MSNPTVSSEIGAVLSVPIRHKGINGDGDWQEFGIPYEEVQRLTSKLEELIVGSKLRLIELKQIIDDEIPTCGEKDCDVCDHRHLAVAKRLKQRLSELKALSSQKGDK